MNTADNAEHEESELDLEVDGEMPEIEEEDGEIEITLGDAAPPAAEEEDQEAPKWVKEVRTRNRELERELRELKKQAAQQPAQAPAVPKLGEKPSLASHEYDEEAYQAALDKWYSDKQAVDDHAKAQQRKQEEAQQSQQQVMTNYTEASKKLRVPDFKDVEELVSDALSAEQQGLILNGADDPAKLVYALGKSPDKLKELASIANPVKFAFAVAKLERDVKVTKRDKPAPETGLSRSGSASRTGNVDKTMERLEAEAEKTGDRTKIIAYRAELRKKTAK
jgi:hypothetical protein